MARRSAESRSGGIRLLILDAHALFCEGLEALFRGERGIGEVVSATELKVGTRLAGRLLPQVILPYPRISDTSPYEVARAIRSRCPLAAFLFLDDVVCQIHVRSALEVGASGYWTKRASFAELAEAVRVVGAGGTSFCPDVQRHVVTTPAGLSYRPPRAGGVFEKLSPRELEVLVLLARGLTVKQCADRMGISASTVDNHKSRTMRKLRVHKTVDLAVLAMREGLLDERAAAHSASVVPPDHIRRRPRRPHHHDSLLNGRR